MVSSAECEINVLKLVRCDWPLRRPSLQTCTLVVFDESQFGADDKRDRTRFRGMDNASSQRDVGLAWNTPG